MILNLSARCNYQEWTCLLCGDRTANLIPSCVATKETDKSWVNIPRYSAINDSQPSNQVILPRIGVSPLWQQNSKLDSLMCCHKGDKHRNLIGQLRFLCGHKKFVYNDNIPLLLLVIHKNSNGVRIKKSSLYCLAVIPVWLRDKYIDISMIFTTNISRCTCYTLL